MGSPGAGAPASFQRSESTSRSNFVRLGATMFRRHGLAPLRACKNRSVRRDLCVCSVSTCNQTRTALAFCTVSCWDAHLPVARHRERGPRSAPRPARRGGRREREAAPARASGGATPPPPPAESEVLSSRAGSRSTSASNPRLSHLRRVLGPLSEIVKRVCDEAIRSAHARRAPHRARPRHPES